MHRAPEAGITLVDTADIYDNGAVEEMLVRAQWAAGREGLTGFVSEQAPYPLLVRGIEAEVLPTCRRYGLGLLVWSPLNGGWLTGKYRRGSAAPEGSRAVSGNPFVRAAAARRR